MTNFLPGKPRRDAKQLLTHIEIITGYLPLARYLQSYHCLGDNAHFFPEEPGWAGLGWAGLGRAGLGWAGLGPPAKQSHKANKVAS